MPNYEMSWKEAFRKAAKPPTPNQMPVDTWDDKEVAVIKGKGCILDELKNILPRITHKV